MTFSISKVFHSLQKSEKFLASRGAGYVTIPFHAVQHQELPQAFDYYTMPTVDEYGILDVCRKRFHYIASNRCMCHESIISLRKQGIRSIKRRNLFSHETKQQFFRWCRANSLVESLKTQGSVSQILICWHFRILVRPKMDPPPL